MKVIIKIVVLIVLLFNVKSVFAQENEFVLTFDQNTEWFKELTNLNHDERLAFIKKRMIQDTSVFNINQRFSEVMIVENGNIANKLKEKGNLAEGRILYFVRYLRSPHKKCKFDFFVWYNGTKNERINQFYNFLTPESIKEIELVTDGCPEIGMFGARGKFGVIIIDVASKKDLEAFRKDKQEIIFNF